MKKEKLPEIDECYYFYDNGVIALPRQYEAQVLNIIPFNRNTKVFNIFTNKYLNLAETWQKEQALHKNIYADKTDYFIECSIPEYEIHHNVWFARHVDGGWFSFDIQNAWQSGRLDVENKFIEQLRKV